VKIGCPISPEMEKVVAKLSSHKQKIHEKSPKKREKNGCPISKKIEKNVVRSQKNQDLVVKA